jgi:hypothetical protein
MDAIMNFFKPKNNNAGNAGGNVVRRNGNNKPNANQNVGYVPPYENINIRKPKNNNLENSVPPETPTTYGGARRRHRKGSRKAHRKGSRSAHRKGSRKTKKTTHRRRHTRRR